MIIARLSRHRKHAAGDILVSCVCGFKPETPSTSHVDINIQHNYVLQQQG